MDTNDLLLFWAKTPQDKNAPPRWHPLLCHLLDVAAVAETLWDQVLGEHARAWCASEVGLNVRDAGCWAAFLAGFHDVGKASPAFAFQEERATRRLTRAGYTRPDVIPPCPHGTISAWMLCDALPLEYGLDLQLARQLGDVVGGHHGVFPARVEIREMPLSARGAARWQEGRLELLRLVAHLFELPDAVPKHLATAAAMWLAGLISVADWIGSNQQYFSLAATDPDAVPDLDPVHYLNAEARPRASRALGELGWLARPREGSTATFRDLFGFEPNVMQADVADAGSSVGEAGLVIVEAPMGEGKTEAALWLAQQRALGQQPPGLYFALPTQATSNAMLGRLREYLEHAHPGSDVNLQLLHGMASLSGELAELRRNGNRLFQPESVDQDTADRTGWGGSPGVLAAEWFTHRKRGLLAPFGVGTIDQALMSVLKSRHVFVRLFGLGGKTVIIDEVHAYDTYMSTLLERLLTWLGALHVSVILLSATLPNDRRKALLRAYADGQGRAVDVISEAPYPRVSWVGNTQGTRALRTSTGSRRSVQLQWVPDLLECNHDGQLLLAQTLEDRCRGSGCVAVICSTVARAQQVYAGLSAIFRDSAGDRLPRVDLFHARFPFDARDLREKRALRRFGKQAKRRPTRAILVATQVIEQSLDVDFDLMVTDPAPVDLLLQRSGRLWRHDRERPASLLHPELLVGRPTLKDDVPIFDSGTGTVYDAHVLLRTWLVLRDRTELSIPDDVAPLIEQVYGQGESSDDLDGTLEEAWRQTLEGTERKHEEDERQAEQRTILAPSSVEPLHRVVHEVLDEDAPQLHQQFQALTRLADPSVTVVCLYGVDSSPSLDRAGAKPVDLRKIPTAKQAVALLRRSVSLSHRAVVGALLRTEAPPSWQKSPLLRHCRPLVFDTRSEVRLPHAKCTIRLDPDLGLVIDRDEKEA